MKMSRKGKIFGYYGVVRRHIITHTREAKIYIYPGRQNQFFFQETIYLVSYLFKPNLFLFLGIFVVVNCKRSRHR